jgi:hypothetical protein
MRSNLFAGTILAVFLVLFSCTNSGNNPWKVISADDDKIKQKDDGTIDLNIESASCYCDNTNPSFNTAEWSIIVSKPGRYKVWLSSATIDTMNLQYNSTVKISLQDERLDVKPVGDKIVLNANEVKYPYYRADSYMGTFYIQVPGEYNLQVINEKAVAQSDNQVSKTSDHTKMMSVFLTPMTR